MRLFSMVGLPRDLLTDRGKPFTSRTMRALCTTLGIQQHFTAIYHPQTDGLVERFNQTLKAMIRKVAHDHPNRWDLYLDALLFAVRETPQASTGITPFDLLYGQRPRGLHAVLQDGWAEPTPDDPRPVVEYMEHLQETLETARAVAQRNMEKAQDNQKRYYDHSAKARRFGLGDLVLVRGTLFPNQDTGLWAGPFSITRVLGPCTYEVQCGPRATQRKVIHLNQLKGWLGPAPARAQVLAELCVDPDGEGYYWDTGCTDPPGLPPLGDALSPAQNQQLRELLKEFPLGFSSTPGRTSALHHAIETEPGLVVWAPWRPLPRKRWEAVEKEVEDMLSLGVIQPSHSEWRSLIILVPKPDGSIRFCFREVNKRAKFDAYPMPWADLLLEQVGNAQYLSSLDLTKEYWQVPLRA